MLRPALELALDVARAGREVTPALPVPRPVERLLGFAKLPAPAWDDLRRAVDGDDGFRRRVALVADEADVGRAGWLWLHRPDGWQDEVEELARAAGTERSTGVAAAERRARREAEREARRRHRNLETERDSLRSQLAAAEEARRRAEAAVAAIEAEAARLRDDRVAAVRRAAEAERRLAAKGAEAKELAREVDRLRAPGGGAGDGSHPAAPDGGPADVAPPPPAIRSAEPPDVAATAGDDPWAGVDRAGVTASVSAAARAAADLARALGGLAEALRSADAPPTVRPDGGTGRDGPGHDDGRAVDRRAGTGTGDRVGRRRPLRLPGGVDETSAEAAAWLVRQPGVAVLIDGYNVSRSTWDDLAIGEQRRRLLAALEELEARTHADLHVVFDGADADVTSASVRRGRHAIRLTFSPAGTDADDVVLDLVDAEPPDRPVVVVTSDGAVRAGAAARGANVVSSRQLLDLLGR